MGTRRLWWSTVSGHALFLTLLKRADVVDCLIVPETNWGSGLYNLEFIKLFAIKILILWYSGEAAEWL